MQAKRHVPWGTRAVLIALAVIACDTESSRRTPIGPAPSPDSTGTIVRLELNGPDTVHINETAQFNAIGVRSDGSTVDMTTQVAWSVSPSSFMTMNAPGQFVGRQSGEPRLMVAAATRTATKSLIVVPPGTYRLKGTVRDAGLPVPVQIRIENDALGTRTIDAVIGQYLVYGVAGETRITVTKSGYEEATRTESIGEHRIIDFDLVLSRSRADVSGTYALTITAADSCRTLADDVRTRTFTASVAQSGPQLTVTLSGPPFAMNGGRPLSQFQGFLEAERAVFRVNGVGGFYYYYYYTPDVVEILSPNQYYSWSGTAVVSLSRDVLEGTLNGFVRTLSGPPFRTVTECQAGQHRFEFKR